MWHELFVGFYTTGGQLILEVDPAQFLWNFSAEDRQKRIDKFESAPKKSASRSLRAKRVSFSNTKDKFSVSPYTWTYWKKGMNDEEISQSM